MKNEADIRDIGKIKKELISRKLELEDILVDLYKEKFSDGQVQDFGDQALSSTMEALQASMQDSRLDEYKRIVMALDMIGEGTYGICIDCHHKISQKRLKSYPHATRCIVCQEAYEEEKGAHFP